MLETMEIMKGETPMSNFAYETQGTNTYLVYEVSSEETVDSMSLGMLTNNNIPGLAQTFFTQIDDKKLIRYNVSSHISVAQFFTGAVNKKRLLGVFSGIVDAMLSAEDYMIDINSIILDLEHIYADVSTCESVLICLPIENPKYSNPELGTFFKQIMFGTQFDQTENCDHVAKIINHLNASPVFSLEEFKKVLEEIKAEENKPVTVVKAKAEPKIEPVIQQQKQPSVPQTNTITQQSVPKAETTKTPTATTTNVPPAVVQQPQQTPTQPEEKGMSWFYLMQHYNKENAAIYKAQKEAKKSKPSQGNTPTPKNVVKQPAAPNNFGYAVPGAPVQQPIPSEATAKQTPPAPVTASTPVQNVIPQGQAQVLGVPTTPVSQQTNHVFQGKSMNFGETTVLGGSGNIGETTVLGATSAVQVKPHLIRTKNNEKILLDKPVFRIGKERSYVDYFIGDNAAISRSHANIISRDGEYFVVDTNSTNHTYVNGQMIQSNVETKIAHGAKIKLANEDFEFRLY